MIEMRRLRRSVIAAVVACAAFAGVLLAAMPRAKHAGDLLLAQDDPAKLSDVQLESNLRGSADIEPQIEDALAINDSGLAKSFLDLAAAKGISISASTTERVTEALQKDAAASHQAARFATGLVTGEATDLASLSGTVAGDLFVFGDIRDVVHEGKRMVAGEEPDRLVLGLASAGIAVTAATYLSAGGAAPVRAGLTLVKDARRARRLSAGLAGWVGRSAEGLVDTPALRDAVASAAVTRPTASLTAIRAAFRTEKAGALLRVAKDVGRVGEKAGARGALDTLRIAEGPKDVARAARLAESKGGQTRAILKLLGRGALLLAAGAFNLALWVFGAMVALVGFLSSIKATTERLTLAWLRRAKLRRARRASLGTQSLSAPSLVGQGLVIQDLAVKG